MKAVTHTPSTIHVPQAPVLPGLTFRAHRGSVDYPVMVDILNACNVADGLEYINTTREIAHVFAHLTNCDPYRDMLFAEVNSQTVAFSRVWWVQESPTRRLYISLGFVHPGWRRKGLGTAMLRYNERCLCEIAGGHPADDKALRVWATDGEYGAHALFTTTGYAPVRHYVEMVRPIDAPLPDAPMPEGLEVRPVEPDQIRPIWEARDKAYRDHWGYVPATEQDYQRWIRERLFAPDLWLVAWDGDQIAGMALNRIDEAQNKKYGRKRGYTHGVFVRRPWRRRGLARALLVRAIEMFREQGMRETALGVDIQNPYGALRLYERVGYTAVKTHTFFNKRI